MFIIILILILLASAVGVYLYTRKKTEGSIKVFEAKYKMTLEGQPLEFPYYFAKINSLSDSERSILKESFNVRDIDLANSNYLIFLQVDPTKYDIETILKAKNLDDLIKAGLQVDCMKGIAQGTKTSDDCSFIIKLMLLKFKQSAPIDLTTSTREQIINYILSIIGIGSDGNAIPQVLGGFGMYDNNKDFFQTIINNIK